MDKKEVVFTVDGPVANIILNRPEKLNSLTPPMLSLLEAYVDEIEANREIRVVLIQAKGTRAFCAGADIKAWAELEPLDMWRVWTRRGNRIFARIENLPMPVVVMVDGIAFGGGLELALCGDFIFATANSRFAFPEVGIATVAGWGGSFRLGERIGPARAKQMLYTGDAITANLACEWGLINEVLPNLETALEKVLAVATRIAANAPVAVACAKQLARLHDRSRESFGAMESLAGGFSAMTLDAREGLQAFFEKRTPDFTGK